MDVERFIMDSIDDAGLLYGEDETGELSREVAAYISGMYGYEMDEELLTMLAMAFMLGYIRSERENE